MCKLLTFLGVVAAFHLIIDYSLTLNNVVSVKFESGSTNVGYRSNKVNEVFRDIFCKRILCAVELKRSSVVD